ncbi:let-413 [Symbiodinium sp. CCMP2592]|nr:let-413 [Symbiodinium sp. CCMP2592]
MQLLQLRARKWRMPTTLRTMFWLLLLRALYSLHRRRATASLPRTLQFDRKPFLAFSGSGLLFAYYHGVVTYIRDHFYVDNLQLSGISGGCSTLLALAMGIDLYEVLLLGLHMKKHFTKAGVYLHDFGAMVEVLVSHFKQIGISDEDVAQLSKRKQCYMGVTKCFPLQHCCINTPATLRELVSLLLSSMSVVPFFRTPGVYQGKYYVDGGFSAMYSVPENHRWDEVIKVTCFPWWSTLLPPAMGVADVQPSRFMPTEVFVLYPWAHQQELIRRGYEDTKKQHDHLVERGLRPLPNAPLTPWSEWSSLFAAIDEENLPPLQAKCSTMVSSEMERHHLEILRTYSHSDLHDALKGPRVRRLSSSDGGSRSEANCSELCSGRAARSFRR